MAVDITLKDVGPTGMDPADATRVRVRKASCRTGTKVIKGWVKASVQQVGDRLKVGSYSCTNDIPRIVCKAKGGKRVRFSIGGHWVASSKMLLVPPAIFDMPYQ